MSTSIQKGIKLGYSTANVSNRTFYHILFENVGKDNAAIYAQGIKVYDNKNEKHLMWICSEELIEVINEYLNDKVVRLENEIFTLECEIDEGGDEHESFDD